MTISIPPTVASALDSIHTTTYFSPVPAQLDSSTTQTDTDAEGAATATATDDDPIILGVDEAGRGPVVGPMVYGIAYCRKSYQDEVVVPGYAFDDSKKLTDPVRRQLFAKMYGGGNELDQIGYATTAISPLDISSGMARFPPTKQYNLNEQAHDTTMALIQGVLDRHVKVSHVYVDTVGPPASYQKKLQERFPGIKFTVEKKADALYCMVSVASVVAKVTRDLLVESLGYESLGSGYPSDPRTKKWLRDNQTPLFGWPQHVVRFSWQTCKTLLEDNSVPVANANANGSSTGSPGYDVQWEEDFISTKKALLKQWEQQQQQQLRHTDAAPPITLDNWYH